MFSNRHFDPVAGSRLYNEYLEHYRLAEEVGFDGIMLNEHHNAPFCMQAKCNVFASILAAMTKRVKIVLLGNPLPLADNPVRLAEELAMIDMVSRGPPRLRLRARRRPGAARHRRQPRLQPRALRGGARPDRHGVDAAGPVPLGGHPLPAPRGEPVGGAAAEAAPARLDPRRAQQGDDHLGGAPALSRTSRSAPRSTRPRRSGSSTTRSPRRPATPAGPENRGYLQRCHVAETEEKALANARQFMWMQGEFTGLAHPVWSSPSGYFSPSYRKAFVEYAVGRRAESRAAAASRTRSATSRSSRARRRPCIPKLRRLLEETRPSILGLLGERRLREQRRTPRTCIRLLGQEVLPAVREMGKELGLLSPFEANAPVSIKYPDRAGRVAEPAVAAAGR